MGEVVYGRILWICEQVKIKTQDRLKIIKSKPDIFQSKVYGFLVLSMNGL